MIINSINGYYGTWILNFVVDNHCSFDKNLTKPINRKTLKVDLSIPEDLGTATLKVILMTKLQRKP